MQFVLENQLFQPLPTLFIGGVNGISGESNMGDMTSLMRRINSLSSIQDYLVTPEQLWLVGISTAPGIVKQFVAA